MHASGPAHATPAGAATGAAVTTAAPRIRVSTPVSRYTCPSVVRGGVFRSFLASADTSAAFVDGDDWLALVNRSPLGALPPEYAPPDLVDVRDASSPNPGACGGQRECLRQDAAMARHRMFAAMGGAGLKGDA